jgi:2-polyprenyl-3-methyl-5-hydroxy-6-metoxy-1,4-benzoquinol methylase
MELIGAVAPSKDARILDVGGGASLLVDRLLDQGYSALIVADVSESALGFARSRLGDRGARVTWLASDVRSLRLASPVDVWHDRAVFHFLTDAADREAYMNAVRGALRIGGHVVIATFGLGGPERCSGLPVERYDGAKLSKTFGADFALLRSFAKRHVTPSGVEQEFTYAVLQRS